MLVSEGAVQPLNATFEAPNYLETYRSFTAQKSHVDGPHEVYTSFHLRPTGSYLAIHTFPPLQREARHTRPRRGNEPRSRLVPVPTSERKRKCHIRHPFSITPATGRVPGTPPQIGLHRPDFHLGSYSRTPTSGKTYLRLPTSRPPYFAVWFAFYLRTMRPPGQAPTQPLDGATRIISFYVVDVSVGVNGQGLLVDT